MKQSENHYKISSGLKFIYKTNQIIFIFQIYVTFGREIWGVLWNRNNLNIPTDKLLFHWYPVNSLLNENLCPFTFSVRGKK